MHLVVLNRRVFKYCDANHNRMRAIRNTADDGFCRRILWDGSQHSAYVSEPISQRHEPF
jgi:hypothetical protein